ncbi:MAG TPA: hypothetical protein VKB38_06635 [Terracidiphilus sp.]|nr:hypothetical protein [Terracidiphilus sp.]
MISKAYLAAGLFLAASPLALASTAIGTASARGDLRVDGYSIVGNATLFDGSAIQTNVATATLRLDKGTEIKMAGGSLGTLYRDHMVLQHGKSEMATSDRFQMDAGGFHVVPTQPGARGVVAVSGLGNIEVAALNGSFQVTNGSGKVMGKVVPGTPKSFADEGAGSVSVTGKVSRVNGHYYVTDSNGAIHEFIGKDADQETVNKGFDKWVGKTVTISGSIDTAAAATGGAVNVIDVSNVNKTTGAMAGAAGGGSNGWTGADLTAGIIEGGAALGALGWGLYATTASR